MKKLMFLLLFFLFISFISKSQHIHDDIICHIPEEEDDMDLRASIPLFSGNGKHFTPKGDLRVLIICAGFGTPYDNVPVAGWDSSPNSIPVELLDKSTFYSDTTDFINYSTANHNKNISRFYYEMSNQKFRLIADVYPKRINIDATGANGFSSLNKKVIEKMKLENPNFNWSKYDSRKNLPAYSEDASVYATDKKPDFVVIVYRYAKNKYTNGYINPIPNPWLGLGGASASSYLSGSVNYGGYTFDNCGFTISDFSNFYNLFIHEVAHNLFDCPHYAYANSIVGNYFYGNLGWGMMNLDVVPFPCSIGWEMWYLNWIENIKTNGANSDIKTKSDLNASGEYILRDFMTTRDVIRIKIPNTGGQNQYLWLENHQEKSIFDKRRVLEGGCNNLFPVNTKGVVAYIESINDDRASPGRHTMEDSPNAIEWLHPAGNFDYIFDSPSSTSSCVWNNIIHNFKEIQPNPIGGQSRSERIRFDFDSNNSIYVNNDYNHTDQKNEGYSVWMRDSVFTYDLMGHDITFKQGKKLSMSSNPCLVNMPTYSQLTKEMTPFILNGISVSVLSFDGSGHAKVKIAFNDVSITNNIRYTGLIHLPNITQNSDPDIIIQPNVTLSIDKSGTPNRDTKTSAGDFINPTEFHCLADSYFKQSEQSTVEVINGSSLIIANNSTYEINTDAKLRIKSGSCLQIKQGSTLQIKGSGEIIIEPGASICIESGASINLQDFNSAINILEGATLGNIPNSNVNANCITSVSAISKTGSGTINLLNQTIYIQNEDIIGNRYIAGKNIYIGKDVTTMRPIGIVRIKNGAKVVFKVTNEILFKTDVDIETGASIDVINQ